MTGNDKKRMIDEIQDYADVVLKDVDKEQVPVSIQIEMLKPKMQELSEKYAVDIADVFVIYMDGISQIQAQKESEFRQKMQDE